MRRAIQYLGVCEPFLSSAVTEPFPSPPQMAPVPSPVWLLTVYGYDILTRLEEYKGRITSTFGSILKMDSTKKVTKKLAGTATDTAAWVTNVGNEHGQVLISVLTCSEGLMRRYRLAEVPPPQIIYVDRDCCNRDGVSKTAASFSEWTQLVVRLDIWHLMRRFASGVTTESHELYPTFMRQLSYCIFQVDPEDARRLIRAKRSDLEGRGEVAHQGGVEAPLSAQDAWGQGHGAPHPGPPGHLRRTRRTQHPEHPAPGRSPHPRHLEYAEVPPQLHIGPPPCPAVHPDRHADQRGGQSPSLPLRQGLRLPGVFPPPPPPVHPRYVPARISACPETGRGPGGSQESPGARRETGRQTHRSGNACQSRTSGESSTRPDTRTDGPRGGSRQQRGRTLPVLARKVSSGTGSLS
ncbi:uncharacterized protein LOC133442253 isoform X2 [Cololabis saira]|uniref:uncharacterized protein LOC133442253 isoform X2 n=1 Tax=Cololabis saira TaxID=129043 RepID=UPI002AD2F275|nr:uncharacterized protein LOC133442253 isoform X2 [Cololabis saira]